MPLRTELDSVHFASAPQSRGYAVWVGVVVPSCLMFFMVLLGFTAWTTRDPAGSLTWCTVEMSDPRDAAICDGIEPTFDGRRLPVLDSEWMGGRMAQILAGAPHSFELDLDGLPHDPANRELFTWAVQVEPQPQAGPEWARVLAARETWDLSRLRDQHILAEAKRLHAEGVRLRPDRFEITLFRLVCGLLAFVCLVAVLTRLRLRPIRTLRDLRTIDVQLHPKRLRFMGEWVPREDVLELDLVGNRLQLRTRRGVVQSPPLASGELLEADELVEALQGLHDVEPGVVPEGLRRLVATSSRDTADPGAGSG